MSERKMCHDCPHKEEHEKGGSILLVKGIGNLSHKCHNAMHLPCVGHQMQIRKRLLSEVVPEDVEVRRTVYVHKDFAYRGCSNNGE